MTEHVETPAPPLPAPRALALHAAWLVPLCLAFAPTAAFLWERWNVSIWVNGHGMFVPLILVYLVHEQLQHQPVHGERASPWGFAFLGAGLLLLALDVAINTQLLAAVGLVVCLPGLSLLLLGAERTRGLWLPCVIAAFMLPVPMGFAAPVHGVLREITAFAAAQVTPWLGIATSLQGTTLHIPGYMVEVAEACSGFSALYASLMMALVLGQLSHSWRRGLLLLPAAVVVAIACNVARAIALVLIIYRYGVDPLETPLHEATGVVAFAASLGILFLIGGREAIRGRAG